MQRMISIKYYFGYNVLKNYRMDFIQSQNSHKKTV